MADKRHQEEPQFCCSVCVDTPKDPVSLNCGHNYCRSCLEVFWDKQEEQRRKYSCPYCREVFSPRPVLRRNNMLAELVENLSAQQASPPAAAPRAIPSDVACDFCSEAERNAATVSCLTCLASYCPAHLQSRHSVPVFKKHQLVSATVPLQEKMCAKHNKLIDVYCRTDEQLVCSVCAVDEHKSHTTAPVSEQRADVEKHLISRQKEIQKRVVQREEELEGLKEAEENLESCADTALEDCNKIFGDLIASMLRRHKEVKRLISEQEKTAAAHAQELRLRLREEVTQLRRRDAELERLLGADDHIHLIQVFRSLSTSSDSPDFSPGAAPLRSFEDVTESVSELRDKLETVLNDTWPRISTTISYVDFSLLPEPQSREDFLRYCRPLTLDVTTNYPYLNLVSKKLMMKPSPSPYAAHPDRFTKFAQVLCEEGVSERCYWEVEWYARTLSAAVAYRDINRASDESRFGNNDKSWSLECTANGYLFRHNNVETAVSDVTSYKIGVYLDYKAGTLCFYQVSEPMVLLHKVKTTFTQPLYPGLGLNYEWYDAGVFAQLVKLW
ncbi:E3 ubiquitin-protein ligase TRIM47-like isoform X1 [Acanthopagrus latus]|uniref:E3 ubiquitin-protein ligase TRIM47-like isoform X1 n=1 Tax=Acanthopagrus latus TaxID=8177 RepID=UPI00187BCF80|nr:E3 ubiquitin-protein ligase TRIM47-like isoform X1 [Acanthopagrus latus]